MTKVRQTRAKQERIIEAVRQELEGDAAIEFVHQSGYAMTQAGIARQLRAMGGKGQVQEYVAQGKSNVEILRVCFPKDELSEFDSVPPSQQELFGSEAVDQVTVPFLPSGTPLYATAKLTLRVPADLYEAVRLAAKAEGKTQNQLIVDVLTSALSRIPGHIGE